MGKATGKTARQGLVVIVDQGFSSIANFLTGVLVARACTKEEYGLYVLAFTLLTTLLGVQTSLTCTPYTVLSPQVDEKDRGGYLAGTLMMHLAISGFVCLFVFLAAGGCWLAGETPLAALLLAVGFAVLFICLRDFTRCVLLAQFRVWASFLVGVSANVVTIGLLFAGYSGGWLSPPTAYGMMAIGGVVAIIIALVIQPIDWGQLVRDWLGDARENWAIGKWLLATTGVYLLSAQIYPWALAGVEGTEEVAAFGACLVLVMALNPLLMGVLRYLNPQAAHAAAKDYGDLRRLILSRTILLAAGLGVLVLLFCLLGEQVLELAYNDKYAGYGFLLILLAVQHSLGAIGMPFEAGLVALGRTDFRFRAEVCAAAVSLLIGLPLVYLFGVFGAAIGLALSKTTLRIVIGACLFRCLAKETA